MGRTCSLTEWAHFVKTTHKANLSYWWVYCRHCVIAAIVATEPNRQIATINTPDALNEYVNRLPPPNPENTEGIRPLVGRRSVMKAHLAQCVHASPIPPNPVVKRRAGKRGVHCAIAEWAHFDRLDKEGYIGNTNYFPVVCKHCVKAHNLGNRTTPAEVLAGRKESMRSHLSKCPYFEGKLPAKRSAKDSKLALNEWQFFIPLDRQPGTYYHFAKCKFCNDAYEQARANGIEIPEPKIILGRKHNMQTHLANCEHILDHEEVLDEIVLSSEEDAEDDALHHPLVPPPQSHIANHRLESTMSASSASASPRPRNLTHAVISPMASGLSRVSSIESNPPTTLETHEGLLQFTLENNLPFSWVESPVMQTLCPQLPSAADFAGPILHRIQQRYEQQLHDRQREMHQICGWTLVVQELSVQGNIGTFVSWLTHPNGVIFPSVLDAGESLTWSSQLNQVSRVVQSHILENLRRQIHVVAVTLPPVDSYFNTLATSHTSVLFLASTSSVFKSMYYHLLHDELCHRALQSASTIAPPPTRMNEAANWLDHILAQRFLDGSTRSLLEVILPLFKELATTTHGTLSLAQTTKLYYQLYSTVVCLPQRLHSLQQRLFGLLETSWASLEQPVFILAYTLHPHYRDQYLKKTRGVFKWSSICDVACYYYDRWFHTRPTTLRGDVMAYAHVTQHIFAPSVVSEFPSINDYILYLNDHAPELSRLMAHLQTIVTNFSFECDTSDTYSEEIAQNLNYILYCQAKSMPKRQILPPQTQLATWREKTSSSISVYSTEDARNTTTIALKDLFE